MIHDHDDHHNEFLKAASQAMAGPSGAAALDSLDWWELLGDLSDPDARTAIFSAFHAQGRSLSSSSALPGILAQPYIERTGHPVRTVFATIRRETARRGPIWTIIGDVGDALLLFDDPLRGVHVVAAADVELHPVDVTGCLAVHEVTVDLADRQAVLTVDDAVEAAGRSHYLGRIAAATEILGASEQAVELAVAYACDREQFGRPIGTFQAVRHLLSWAQTDCTAVDSVIRKALLMAEEPPAHFGEVVKALAGRNGRRACERSLQVFGGIGFTTEHQHHHLHSRVLLLDALLGSSAELSHKLGTWLRECHTDPGFASAVLVAEHP